MGGRGSGSKRSLVLTERAGGGDSHEGWKLLGHPGRGDEHMELKDAEEVPPSWGRGRNQSLEEAFFAVGWGNMSKLSMWRYCAEIAITCTLIKLRILIYFCFGMQGRVGMKATTLVLCQKAHLVCQVRQWWVEFLLLNSMVMTRGGKRLLQLQEVSNMQIMSFREMMLAGVLDLNWVSLLFQIPSEYGLFSDTILPI